MKRWTILFSCRLDRVHQKVLEELLTLILILVCLQNLLQMLLKLDNMKHLLLVPLIEDLKMNLGNIRNKEKTKNITETNRQHDFPDHIVA